MVDGGDGRGGVGARAAKDCAPFRCLFRCEAKLRTHSGRSAAQNGWYDRVLENVGNER